MHSSARLALILALAASGGIATAAPPSAAFLTATAYTAARGENIQVRFACVAAGAKPESRLEAVAWPADVGWLLIRGVESQDNRHDVRPARAGDNSIAFALTEPGVVLIGADRTPATIEMTGAELREFASRNTAPTAREPDGALPPADAKAPVRIVSSAKLLVRSADADGRPRPEGCAAATSKTGQAAEIQPLADPTALRVGSDLPLRVFIAGDKQPGARVQATSPSGKTESFVADPVGSGHIRIHEAGLWRIEFHTLARDEAGEHRDASDSPPRPARPGWVIHTATLTFEVPAERGAP